VLSERETGGQGETERISKESWSSSRKREEKRTGLVGALVLVFFSPAFLRFTLCSFILFFLLLSHEKGEGEEEEEEMTVRGQATNLLALIRSFPLFRPFLSIMSIGTKKGSPQALNIQIFIVIIFNTSPQNS